MGAMGKSKILPSHRSLAKFPIAPTQNIPLYPAYVIYEAMVTLVGAVLRKVMVDNDSDVNPTSFATS